MSSKDDRTQLIPGAPRADEDVLVKEKPTVKRPSLYQVLLHNDDYTTMEYVVHVLMKFFHKNEVDATNVMLKVHKAGVGIAGVYPYEIAETKVVQVTEDARRHEYPLRCTMEKAE
jgi:ATP-dependent Clp protease adaptor protein ClpS